MPCLSCLQRSTGAVAAIRFPNDANIQGFMDLSLVGQSRPGGRWLGQVRVIDNTRTAMLHGPGRLQSQSQHRPIASIGTPFTVQTRLAALRATECADLADRGEHRQFGWGVAVVHGALQGVRPLCLSLPAD